MSRRWLSTFQSDLPRLVRDLEALVRLESPSDDAARVTQLAAWVHDRLRERGVAAELRPCHPRGDALLASVAFREGGTLLLGHLDTVWPAGTLADLPWRLDGGRASGPGVFDMKAGIVVGMAVLTAMVRESRPHPVSLLLVPDEEAGSAASRELTRSVARRHRRVLVLEPSQDGAAKVARKGCGVFHLRFSGRAAHAGLEPEKGASALAEMARFVLFLEGIAEPPKGTTLTASVARGGSATNVVPEAAELAVDARAWTREEAERVTAAIRGYRPCDLGVTVAVEGGFDRPPLEPTVASEALYQAARRLAGDLGLELGAARVGGASDGNFTAAAGIPTLDGLGPVGGGAHARDEHVLVADLPVRAALLAALVSEP
jgi:glutamate carboxypeptidase